MSEPLPPPLRHCPACGQGHHAAVPFCPFCGAAQPAPRIAAETSAPWPDAPPTVRAVQGPAWPVAFRLEPDPPAAAPPPPPAAAPPFLAPPPPEPEPPVATGALGPRRTRPGWRRPILALLAIAALSALALARRDALPAPSRLVVGPDWTALNLETITSTPLVRFTGDKPFSLRLDGERVLRVAPGSGASLRVRTLNGLELRAAQGSVTVTLTPRRE